MALSVLLRSIWREPDHTSRAAIRSGSCQTTPTYVFSVTNSPKRQQDAVPEGHLIIARRFNAGKNQGMAQVPKGRLNGLRVACEDGCHQRISRPFGTKTSANSNPALKRRALIGCPSGTSATASDDATLNRYTPTGLYHLSHPRLRPSLQAFQG